MCVGFILVIILSKQKLITSKDSISKPCLSEVKGGRAAAAAVFSARRDLGGPGSGDRGTAAPKQHCWEAKMETSHRGAVKSGAVTLIFTALVISSFKKTNSQKELSR